MKEILVDPLRLSQTALKIEEESGKYDQGIERLYQEVDKMASYWSGKDNQAFVGQIKSYSGDFKQISIIIKQYVDFLKNSAKAYIQTQDEITALAGKLKG